MTYWVQQSLRWLALTVVAVTLLLPLPATAVGLGESIMDQPVQLKQIHGHPAFDQQSGPELVRAIANDGGTIFQIEIQSENQSAPRSQDYLGVYKDFAEEVVRIIPLKARFTRYTDDQGHIADWAVFGKSGRFYAMAFSEDQAPADWSTQR